MAPANLPGLPLCLCADCVPQMAQVPHGFSSEGSHSITNPDAVFCVFVERRRRKKKRRRRKVRRRKKKRRRSRMTTAIKQTAPWQIHGGSLAWEGSTVVQALSGGHRMPLCVRCLLQVPPQLLDHHLSP